LATTVLDACAFFFSSYAYTRAIHSFPTRRSSDLFVTLRRGLRLCPDRARSNGLHRVERFVDHRSQLWFLNREPQLRAVIDEALRSEEHTSELQSRGHLVCPLLLEKKKKMDVRHVC